MPANLLLRMKTTGDKAKAEQLGKGLKKMF